MRKQGYLTKTNDKLKEQQRYYVLEKGTLTWYLKPMGKRIDTVDLKAKDTRIKGLGLRYFLITTTISGEFRKFILSGRDEAETLEWLTAVKAAAGRLPTELSLSSSSSHSTHAGGDGGEEGDPKTAGTWYGWMTKKGKERWFLLREGVLYWFTRELPPTGDVRREMRGSLALDGCQLVGGYQSSLFQLIGGGETYSFQCKSQTECSEWVQHIGAALKAIEDATEPKLMGWLEKKKQRHWFVYNRGVLQWFAKEGDAKERGQLSVGEFDVFVGESRSFSLIHGETRYDLVAPTASESAAWVNTLKAASERIRKEEGLRRQQSLGSKETVEKKGWFLKKRKRRFCVLRNHVLMWFVDEHDISSTATMKGSLDLRECTVTAHGFEISIRSKEGGTYDFQSNSKEEVAEWVQGIKDAVSLAAEKASVESKGKRTARRTRAEVKPKRGWTVKRGKKRFLVLRQGELVYYDKQVDGENPTDKPKGTIQLAVASVSEVTAESFLVRSEGMTYGWVFECSASDATEWVNSISAYIVLARESLETGLSMSGWMIKKNARRWFALRHGVLYWFNTVQSVDRVNDTHANGSLSLRRCTIVPMEGRRNTLAITPPADSGNTRVYDLECYTAAECAEWMKALKTGLADAAVATYADPASVGPKGLVLGLPLLEVLDREGGDLPILVTTCVEYLRAHALDSPGIFRLSGSASAVAKLKELFDRGEAPRLEEIDTDNDSVAGILKLFLRLLPEPVIPFEFYEDFLDCADKPDAPAIMRDLCDRLPTANADLLRYLMRFLAEVVANSEVNQMNVNNIAIVVGPNLLRAKELDMAAGLKDTPLVLSCARILVKSHAEIFEDVDQ